jgi:hypothetical protein
MRTWTGSVQRPLGGDEGRPHMSQQGRNALEDLNLVDHNDRADSPGPTAVHDEAVTP